jgi:transposase
MAHDSSSLEVEHAGRSVLARRFAMVLYQKRLTRPESGGPRRVNDRRVISGIIHVLQSGMRWRDCPKEYGPSTTIYNRWHRWSQQGMWQRMFNELSQIVGTHYENAIDSTATKVHRSARGKKGARTRPSAQVAADAQPKSTP